MILIITRFAGNHYDNLRHLHPDERWLVMVVGKLHFFDQLNPDFFAYGSFPLYVLKAVAQTSDLLFFTKFDTYDGLLVLGRFVSSTVDITTAIIIFLIARKITKNIPTALFAMFGYTLLFFPIQNSNFFIVDNFVNLLFSLTLLLLLEYIEKPKIWQLLILAISFGLLLSSKITPILLLAPILLIIVVLPFINQLLKPKTLSSVRERIHLLFLSVKDHVFNRTQKSQSLVLSLFKAMLNGAVFLITTFLTVSIGMPYTIINYQQFFREISAQMTMNNDAYIFPYTLQYVDTTAYAYYIKQIFFWGAGPILSLVFLLGLLIGVVNLKEHWRKKGVLQTIFHPMFVYLFCNLFYFLVIGRSAVKFMRYMLPLYPAVAICIGVGLGAIFTYRKLPKLIRWLLVGGIFISATGWTLAFLTIYSRPHSRESASIWMLQNIPPGSVLAEEHWDDRLPLFAGEQFQYVDLPLYELPDDATKWQLIANNLKQADYIVMTSNRLYGSLPKLADCSKYKKCYPLTAEYYQDLFAEKLDFVKVAEFTSRPSFFGIEIVDDNADESFTVYDHPRVIIFQRR